VRSLKLLWQQVSTLRHKLHRDLEYLDGNEPPDTRLRVTHVHLAEAIERSKATEEAVLSAVEQWTDCVPDADILAQIRALTEAQEREDEARKEVERLDRQLRASAGPDAETEQLRAALAKKEEELRTARAETLQRHWTARAFSSAAADILGSGRRATSLGAPPEALHPVPPRYPEAARDAVEDLAGIDG
jgi:hypothetical protein